MDKVNVGVIGSTGYTGIELIKILNKHPKTEIVFLGAKSQYGKNLSSIVPSLLSKKDIKIKGANVLILGITFKENCPDIRNTKILDVYNELISFGAKVDVFDSVANKEDVKKELKIDLIADFCKNNYAAIILAVAHEDFKSIDFKNLKSDKRVIFDAKSFIDIKYIDGRL